MTALDSHKQRLRGLFTSAPRVAMAVLVLLAVLAWVVTSWSQQTLFVLALLVSFWAIYEIVGAANVPERSSFSQVLLYTGAFVLAYEVCYVVWLSLR